MRIQLFSGSRCGSAALILFTGLFVAANARASGFKIYQLQIYCSDSPVATVILGYTDPDPNAVGTKVLCAGHCSGDKVPIKDVLGTLPAGASKGLQAEVQKYEEEAAAGGGRSLAGCECDNAKMDRLKGRIRGLREAADAHRKDFNQKTAAQAGARDRLWGKGEGLRFESGSIAEFGKSVRDSLMIAGGGSGVGKVLKKADEAKGWVETAVAIGSTPDSLDTWAGYGQEVLGKKVEEVFQQRSEEALRAAREHFARTGNYAGAQRVYREKWAGYGQLKDFQKVGDNITSFLDALGKLADLAKKTDALTKDLTDWKIAYQDAQSLQSELDKIDKDIQRAIYELAQLRADCIEISQSSQPLLFARLGSAAGGFGAGISDAIAEDAHFLKVAQSAPVQPRLAIQRAEQALRKLAQLKGRIQAVDRWLGADLVGPLSPWFGGAWQEAQPRDLLVPIAKGARSGLRRFNDAIKGMTPIAGQADAILRSIPPAPGP